MKGLEEVKFLSLLWLGIYHSGAVGRGMPSSNQ